MSRFQGNEDVDMNDTSEASGNGSNNASNEPNNGSSHLIPIQTIQLLLDHPSQHIQKLLGQHSLSSLTATQLQHPVFHEIVKAAAHMLDLELAEQLGEANALLKYNDRLIEQNKAHAQELVDKDKKHTEELAKRATKYATDMEVMSAAKDLRILELTGQLEELKVKVLEATGPKLNISMRPKDDVDKEPEEDLEQALGLLEAKAALFKAARYRAPRNKLKNV
jgi:hypothetical protein